MKSTAPFFTEKRQCWLLLALTCFTFFTLLGSRALNEPDEGRYAEIAREMVDTGDWLVPHLWYLPHLDKPPMTYWLVAISLKLFGQNEWAVRLPLALAGVSGVWAVYLLGGAVNGPRTGRWSALILQTSLLYFGMARMLTTDLFLTVFTAWAMFFLWRSWQCLAAADNGKSPAGFFGWHLAGWTALALAFLTKGPIAAAIPAVAFGALLFFRRGHLPRKKALLAGVSAGCVWFLVLAAPWFLLVFQRVPSSAHYMILGQAAGHLLGTTVKNRNGSVFYFFGILAVGLLPWTLLLGWLWRRRHWRGLTAPGKDAWLWLNAWAIFTFTLFSLSHSKLPPYILPLFPALAILLAWRFFDGDESNAAVPKVAWRLCAVGALLLPAVGPLALQFAFRNTLPPWMKWQPAAVAVAAAAIFWFTRKLSWKSVALLSATLALPGFLLTVAELSRFETSLRRNQPFQSLGQALHEQFRPGDAVVCWGRMPQGLPFYSGGAISAANRPYFGGIEDHNELPFDYPSNREQLGERVLPDENALVKLLHGPQHVLVVGYGDTVDKIQNERRDMGLHLIFKSGQWELYTN